jgi:hypothetical protein
MYNFKFNRYSHPQWSSYIDTPMNDSKQRLSFYDFSSFILSDIYLQIFYVTVIAVFLHILGESFCSDILLYVCIYLMEINGTSEIMSTPDKVRGIAPDTHFSHTTYCHMYVFSSAQSKKRCRLFSDHLISIVRVRGKIKQCSWEYFSSYFFFIPHINSTMALVEHLKWVRYLTIQCITNHYFSSYRMEQLESLSL